MSFKKVITSAIVMSMVAVSALNTVAANAATVDETQEAITNNKSETAKLLKDIATANADNIKLQQQITDNTTKIETTKTNIDQSTQKIATLKTQITSAKAEVQKRTTVLKAQLVALQKQTGDTVSGNVYFDFVLNSKDFSDLVARSFTVNKLNQASKSALEDVKVAKAEYSNLMTEQETTKSNLQSEKTSLEAQQTDLKAMKAKSDQQQDALNQKVNDNKATLEALQTQYDEAASALKVANDTKAKETKVVKTAVSTKDTSDKAEATSTSNDSKASTSSKIENKTSDNSESKKSNDDSDSQGDGSTHGNVAGNSYAWGQCTWYVKQVAPWAGNNWGNGGQWGASASAAGFRVDHTPSAGAIIVFVPGQSVGGQWTADPTYGHVGYVQSVSGSSVTITQGGMGFANAAGPNTATLSDGGSYMYIHR